MDRERGDDVAVICAPWRHHLGPPPPADSPLAGVFGAGMRYTEHLLSEMLGVEEYEPGSPGAGRDDEARDTLANILRAAGLAVPDRTPDADDDGWPGPDPATER